MLTVADRGRGVKICQNLADVIYECSLYKVSLMLNGFDPKNCPFYFSYQPRRQVTTAYFIIGFGHISIWSEMGVTAVLCVYFL